jgi:hypothetical protein
MALTDTVLNTLKEILGIELTDTTKDNILSFALDDAESIIFDHCHIVEMPVGLTTTLIKMARDIYLNENLGNEAVALGSISTIEEGNAKTQFRSSATEFKDSILKNYSKKLNAYRIIKWT